MTTKRAVAKAISVATVAACMAGCATPAKDVPAPLPAGWPPGWDNFSFVWTAEPGIDVTAQPVVAVRAYVESYQLAELLGDDRYLYPGFTDALDPSTASGSVGPLQLQPSTRGPSDNPWVGTERNNVLSVTPMDGGMTIVLCQYTYAVGTLEREGGRYITQDGGHPEDPAGGISAMRIIVRAPAAPQPSDASQHGPARTPSVDVFGGYRITDVYGGYFPPTGGISEWSAHDAVEASCVAKAPDPVEWRKQFTGNYHTIKDFPVLPPTPGWPEKPA
jgi:hypothetical protein